MKSRFAVLVFFLGASLLALETRATDKDAGKEKTAIVDSGSFAILVNGRRVATESFRMEQHNGSNTVSSELRSEGSKSMQSAEMEVGADGALKRYVWKEVNPGKAQIVVEPQDSEFLVAHISDDGAAPKDVTHPLSPAVTSIVDDNFFSQLQVLAWKYMVMGCHKLTLMENRCKWTELKLPIFNPHQQQSLVVTLNFAGRQNIKWKGSLHEFNTFRFTTEAGEWMLWFDDQQKLVRILIAADNTEVLRD